MEASRPANDLAATLDDGNVAPGAYLPRVEPADEVRDGVRSTRFRYDGAPGDRGLESPRARRWGLAEAYVATEDREPLVGVPVETEASIENPDDILTVPELESVLVGPLDPSVSLGSPGEIDRPMVQEAVETVRSKAVDASVPVAGLGFGMDDVTKKATNGYRMLSLESTTGALEQTVTGWFDASGRSDA